jgi:hypothetical protein
VPSRGRRRVPRGRSRRESSGIREGGSVVISDFIQWTTHLNQTNHLAFALVTVGLMTATGLAIAVVAELVFKLLGIRTDRLRHHH